MLDVVNSRMFFVIALCFSYFFFTNIYIYKAFVKVIRLFFILLFFYRIMNSILYTDIKREK